MKEGENKFPHELSRRWKALIRELKRAEKKRNQKRTK
jgi:hypothetical protein